MFEVNHNNLNDCQGQLYEQDNFLTHKLTSVSEGGIGCSDCSLAVLAARTNLWLITVQMTNPASSILFQYLFSRTVC